MSEPVDVAGFVAGLAAAGLLAPEHPPEIPAVPDAAAAHPGPGRIRLGRALYSPVGLLAQSAFALAVPAVLMVSPHLRPSYRDLVIGPVPVLSMLVISVLMFASAMEHEGAHWLAAAAIGVPSRITVSRRLVSLVLQTDLTRLWGVPRRKRIVPLVAGMLGDAATAGLLLALAAVLPPERWLDQGARTIALIKLTGMAAQLLVFMRTDVYALCAIATRSRNLWDLKGALARRAIRRVSTADAATLAASTRRERRWAGAYLALYLPGLAWTAW
jgi:putative peptide zinc metalloprotease protein